MKISAKFKILSFRIIISALVSVSLFISLLNFFYYMESLNSKLDKNINVEKVINYKYTFSDIIEKSLPSVVSIKVTRLEKRKYSGVSNLAEDFLNFFNNQHDNAIDQLIPDGKIKKRKVIVGGSGFFVSEDGTIITNYHVLVDAKKIEIEIEPDNFIDASIIGVDPMKDIAIIKVNTKKKINPIKFGNSDLVKIGDVVLAIGSPFNLNGTVTSGIISSKSRKLGGVFDDFIQTDASINSGNSGGPMINLDGEVIGMNTAIITPNGANIGLGFAIPSNVIIETINDLKNKKNIKRGKIGIVVQKMDDKFTEAIGIKEKNLPIIVDIEDDSPAKISGLQIGDVVISIDGEKIKNYEEVAKIISNKNPNENVSLSINRYGQNMKFDVILTERKFDDNVKKSNEELIYVNGLGLKTIDQSVKSLLKINNAIGVLIVDIVNDDIIEDGTLEVGDIILQVNGNIIKNVDDFKTKINKNKNKYVVLEINKNGLTQLVTLKISNI